MTVASLWSSLSSPPPTALPPLSSVAIDTPQQIIAATSSPALATLHKHPFLYLTWSRCLYLLSHNIDPVYVYEGSTAPILHANQQTLRPLLAALGVPHINAPSNAEAVAAGLNERGLVDAVISSDSDALLYGAKTLVTDFTVENCRASSVTVFKQSSLHTVGGNEIGRRGLIAYAMLAGSDEAAKGVAAVGATKALKFLSDLPPSTDPLAALRELKTSPHKLASKVAAIADFPNEQVIAKYLNAHSPAIDAWDKVVRVARPSLTAVLAVDAATCLHGFGGAGSRCKLVQAFLEMIVRYDMVHSCTGSREDGWRVDKVSVKGAGTRGGAEVVTVEWIVLVVATGTEGTVELETVEPRALVERWYPVAIEVYEKGERQKEKEKLFVGSGKRSFPAAWGVGDGTQTRGEGTQSKRYFRSLGGRGKAAWGGNDLLALPKKSVSHRLFSPPAVAERSRSQWKGQPESAKVESRARASSVSVQLLFSPEKERERAPRVRPVLFSPPSFLAAYTGKYAEGGATAALGSTPTSKQHRLFSPPGFLKRYRSVWESNV